MRLLTLAIVGNTSVTARVPEQVPGRSGLLVLSGPNGSGKSLLASALVAALADTSSPEDARVELLRAAASRLFIEYSDGPWVVSVACDSDGHSREVNTRRIAESAGGDSNDRNGNREATSRNSGQPEEIAVGELFPLVHVVRSGRLMLRPPNFLRETIVTRARVPLERELAVWLKRQTALAGEPPGTGGKLSAARSELQTAELELQRVETLGREFEAAEIRKRDLFSRLADARAASEMLAAESEQVSRLTGLSERARRLEEWAGELSAERAEVQSLRQQHSDLQARLDAYEERFRNAPENFPELSRRFKVLAARERVLLANLASSQEAADKVRADLNAVRELLAELSPPRLDSLQSKQEILQRELAVANSDLTEILRARIELIRRREGVRQRIRRDFVAFAELSPEQRDALQSVSLMNEPPQVENLRAAEEREQVRDRRARLAALRLRVQTEFADFDQLPAATPDRLHELHDHRRVLSALMSDLEGLRKRGTMLRRRARPGRDAIIIGIAAVVAFVAGTISSGWDIGLFAAVAASGLALLVCRHLNRHVESEIESAESAEAMVLRRFDESRENVDRLERELGPLAGVSDVEQGIARFAEYKTLRAQIGYLETKLGSLENEPEPDAPTASPLDQLPDLLREMPFENLKVAWHEFLEMEEFLRSQDREWQSFAEGGDRAGEIQALETRVATVKQEISELTVQSQMETEAYGVRRAELSDQANRLERELTDMAQDSDDETELAAIRSEMLVIQSGVGDLLAHAEPDQLERDWNDRDEIRARLKDTRRSLSAHQTWDELRARESLLAEEMAEVRQKITELDPLYLLQGSPSDYASKYAGQLQATSDHLAENQKTIKSLQAEGDAIDLDRLKQELSKESTLDSLQQGVAQRKQQIREIEREFATTQELVSSISRELNELAPEIETTLATTADEMVRELSAGRFISVDTAGADWDVSLANGQSCAVDSLSEGLQDLIWISMRLAILKTISEFDDAPLFWDEALSRLDDSHLERVRKVLTEIAAKRQVILLTRHAAIRSWGTVIQISNDPESVAAIMTR